MAAPLPDADPITGNPYSIQLPQHVQAPPNQEDPAQASPLVGPHQDEVW